jgi:hypothetical protein
MNTLLRKHSTILTLSLLLAFLILLRLFPSWGLIFGIFFLLCSLFLAGLSIIGNHRQQYLDGKITRATFLRSVVLELMGVILAMVLAGLLARYLAELVTRQVGDELIRYITGIAIGVGAGIFVGVCIRQIWGRLVKISSPH